MARFNGQPTMAIQVVKRKGSNLIQTVNDVKKVVNDYKETWPVLLQKNLVVDFSLDNSKQVKGMVDSLESAVLTAIALVMIVVLASLGTRSALLVGFAIPMSFMLTFALLAIFNISISNIVMFGLILAVGMLVDGAIIVVEYADKEIKKILVQCARTKQLQKECSGLSYRQLQQLCVLFYQCYFGLV